MAKGTTQLQAATTGSPRSDSAFASSILQGRLPYIEVRWRTYTMFAVASAGTHCLRILDGITPYQPDCNGRESVHTMSPVVPALKA